MYPFSLVLVIDQPFVEKLSPKDILYNNVVDKSVTLKVNNIQCQHLQRLLTVHKQTQQKFDITVHSINSLFKVRYKTNVCFFIN